MKKIGTVCFCLALVFLLVRLTANSQPIDQKQTWTADNGNGTFTNPLFYEEFSDPI